MENRLGNSHGGEIPKKSRSLDLKSLYKSNGSKVADGKNLKRKGSVDGGGDEKRHERKKRRKAVSISSLKNVYGNGSKSLEEVYNGSLSSSTHDSKDSKLGLNQRLNDRSGFGSISLEGSIIQIPRRKRGRVGRRKVEDASQLSKPAVQSSGEVDNDDQAGELTGEDKGKQVESLKAKHKKGFENLKDNGNGESISGSRLEGEDGHVDHSVVNSNNSSLKKSQTGHSLENNGDSSLKKPPRKQSRKMKDVVPSGKNVANDGSSIKISDDEENLEENAARMLSSRFDPSCTGFSSSSKSSVLPSTDGLSVLLTSGQEHVDHGSGSESASVDTDGRVLRPRKQLKDKENSGKRRRYYQVLCGDLDAYWALNRRIKVFWPLDQSWYYGLVNDYDKERKLHHVKYDDRDEEWINLQNERFKLLLLPSEVPGKASCQLKQSGMAGKDLDEEKGKLKPSKEKKVELITEDDSPTGNYMDSVPIISWLPPSTRRVKSSPLCSSKKQKASDLTLYSEPPLLSEEAENGHESMDEVSLSRDKSKLQVNSPSQVGLISAVRNETSAMDGPPHPEVGKLPVVYYRRRFRKMSNVSCHTSEDNSFSTRATGPDASIAPVFVASGVLENHNVSLEKLDQVGALEGSYAVDSLWSTNNAGLLRLKILLTESRCLKFELGIPVLSVGTYLFGTENAWWLHAVFLLQYGTVMKVWPRVHLEMLFVDNMVGLRFLLFEGCLKQALEFVLLVLKMFHQSNEQRKYADLQFPVTSIRFKFSCIQDFGKHLIFAFYNFSEVENSKWMYLDNKLMRHTLFSGQLPLSECTYDNIKALQSGTNRFLGSSMGSISIKEQQRRSKQGVSLMDVSRESAANQPSLSDPNNQHFLPWALSFTAAPNFFLGLHLKLLMEHRVTPINFQDHDPMVHPEKPNSLQAADDCSGKGSENTLDNNLKASSRDNNSDGCLSCGKLEPVCSVDLMQSSVNFLNGDVNVGTLAIAKDHGKFGTDAIASLQKWQGHNSEMGKSYLLPSPSVERDKFVTESHSPLNSITVEIPSFNQSEKHVEKELNVAQQYTDLSWSMNGGIIPSPNPTARRSSWHRNRNSSTSFGSLAHGWSDGRTDFLHNNFGSGPKKPRTQVSYVLPLGGYDYNSKGKSHQHKGLPHKRIRTTNERRSSDVYRGSERNMEDLSCVANVLVTVGDRGWRECGAQVVLELFDHNEWKLAVKLSGTTKYSYKPHQFLQPGSTNRYTHAMMWKGGKDWILEFSDRSQWAIFKEMHEECYNRNIRAASVKNIPIPGVHLVEENNDNGTETPLSRSSKYFRQIETDVEMALDPSRVLYDMDGDDEQWVLKNQSSSEVDNGISWEISDEMFEKTMDMLEKAAYSQQCDHFMLDEIDELMAGVGPMGAIKTIYEYWQQKRKRKGMPLIRHLQPPLWERYQQQVREWELAMTKSNNALSNGCHEKAAPVEKPPMFAFCLKPRGLEVPNKGSKQRSNRKFSVVGQSSTYLGDCDGFHAYGRRLNGFAYGHEKAGFPGHYYEAYDDSPLPPVSPRVFSPRDSASPRYFSMSGDRYDRNHLWKFNRSKSKKIGTVVSPNDAQIISSYNQRMLDNSNGINGWNMVCSDWPGQRQIHGWNLGFSDWAGQRQYNADWSLRHDHEQLDGSDLDEFRLRDASGAAKHALNMAKLKRERAQRLLYRADIAIHKAVVALMTAEAIKASSEELNGSGELNGDG